MKKEQLNRINLDQTPTYITDTSETSPDVFRITSIPKQLSLGKNLIKLQGNPDNLTIGVPIQIEILDYNRNPIYNEILEYQTDSGERVIAIYIYDTTSAGGAIITLAAELDRYNQTSIPFGWQNKINIKWIKTIPVNPGAPNNTEVIFVEEPSITISEQITVQLDRTYPNNQQFPVYTIGSVEFYNYNNTPALSITGGVFTADMANGTITIAAPVNPQPTPNFSITSPIYETKIKKVLNETSVLLEDPFTFYSSQSISQQEYTSFDPSPFSLSYEASPTYTPTQHSESFALLEISNLEPSTGDITRIKAYTNNPGTIGTWNLSNDINLTETEIFVDATGSIYPDVSVGIFTTQSVIDSYWQGYTYIGNSTSTTPTLTWSTASLSNAMIINNSVDITANNHVAVAQIKNISGNFVKDSQYKISFDAKGARNSVSGENNPKIAVYLSGSAFDFDSTDILNQDLPVILGKRIGEIESYASSQRFDDNEFIFDADNTGEAVLLLVVEAGAWEVSDVQTVTSAETGYTENYTRLRTETPVKHKSDNQASFKIEYYNVEGVKSKTISYTDDQVFEGGNKYIDGDFSMLTGSLYVADTLESGIDISGLKNTGFIRSLPYGGFNQATGSGSPGFLIFSGSALPNQSATTYEGVGLEMVADANNYFRFRTNPSILDIRTETIFLSGSNVEINTPNFFLGTEGGVYLSGSNSSGTGILSISASNFSVSPEGAITASDALLSGVTYADFFANKQIIITAANSGSYFKYAISNNSGDKFGYCVLDLSGVTGPFGDGEAAMYVRMHVNPIAPISAIIAPGGSLYDGEVVIETYGPAYAPDTPSCGHAAAYPFGFETIFQYHWITETGSYFNVQFGRYAPAMYVSYAGPYPVWTQVNASWNGYFSSTTAATPPPGQPQNDTLGKIRSSRCRITYEELDWASLSYYHSPDNPGTGTPSCGQYSDQLNAAPGGRYHFAPGDSGWRLQSVSNNSGSRPYFPDGIILQSADGTNRVVKLGPFPYTSSVYSVP